MSVHTFYMFPYLEVDGYVWKDMFSKQADITRVCDHISYFSPILSVSFVAYFNKMERVSTDKQSVYLLNFIKIFSALIIIIKDVQSRSEALFYY